MKLTYNDVVVVKKTGQIGVVMGADKDGIAIDIGHKNEYVEMYRRYAIKKIGEL